MAAKASGSSGSSGSPTVLPTASEATRPRRTKAGNRLPAVMKALRESDDGNSRVAIRSPGKAVRVLMVNDEANAGCCSTPPGHELSANSLCAGEASTAVASTAEGQPPVVDLAREQLKGSATEKDDGQVEEPDDAIEIPENGKLRDGQTQEKSPLPDDHNPGCVNDGNVAMNTTLLVQCCVCGNVISNDDVKVVCISPQCGMAAHATCGGYSLRGASRAKFLCATHKASKVSKSSAVKTKPKARQSQLDGSGRSGTQAVCSQTAPQTESCAQQPYESLLEAYTVLEAAFNEQRNACKQECRELKLYNIKLEERILSLEKDISTLKSKLARAPNSHNLVKSASIGPRPASDTAARRSYAQALSGESSRIPPTATGKFSHTRVFYKTKPTNGSTSSNIASKIIRGSRSQRISPGRRQDREHTQVLPSANFRIVWGTKLATKVSEIHEAIVSLLPSIDATDVRVKKSIRRLSPDKSKWWFTILAQDEILADLDSAWANLASNVNWKIQHSLGRPELPDTHSLGRPELPDSSDDDHTNGALQVEAAAPAEAGSQDQGSAVSPTDLNSLAAGDHYPLPPLTTAEDIQTLQPSSQSLVSQVDNLPYCTTSVPSSAKRLEPGCALDLDSTERQSVARECG